MWEKTNPLQLEDADMLNHRVMYAHKASMNMLRFHPELYYDTAIYMHDSGKIDEALKVLEESIQILPLRYPFLGLSCSAYF